MVHTKSFQIGGRDLFSKLNNVLHTTVLIFNLFLLESSVHNNVMVTVTCDKVKKKKNIDFLHVCTFKSDLLTIKRMLIFNTM